MQQPSNPQAASMSMESLIKHTNVIVNLVAENQELRARLVQADAVIRSQEERLGQFQVHDSEAAAEGAASAEHETQECRERQEGREVDGDE